ncbi:protein MRVI1 isoform X1 [Gadus morhua]|uniref:protein MRVI1 isoform X1 n=1 Tax=Gadus morhua TaxID=8049 RepID=UPI0011B5FDD8|nr:protein MRVI1 isoform X1 [Gadus morhua]
MLRAHCNRRASSSSLSMCMLRELELPRSAWEDKGDKVQDLGQNQTKPKTHSQSPALAPAPGARNVAVVNLWRALNVEGTKTRTSRDEDSHSCQALCEARTKLQQAERTIGEMKVHLRHLQAALKTEQEHVIECQTTHAKTASPVLHPRDEETNTDTESRTEAPLLLNTRDEETNTDTESRTEAPLVLNTRDEETNTDTESRKEAALVLNTRDKETNTDTESRTEAALVLNTRDEETNTDTESRTEAPPVQELVRAREVKDAAVGPDLDKDNARRDAAERQGVAHGLTADGLLASLRKMEALISGALETAEGVRQSEQRVSLVRERMESIAQKVREALGRAADTDLQLSALEARGLEGDQAVLTAPIASQCLVSITADSTVTADTGPTYTGPLASPPPPPSPPMSQEAIEQPLTNADDKAQENNNVQKQQEEERRPIGSGVGLSGRNPEKTCEAPCVAEAPFIFPHTRSRPTQLPTMPTLPEEEEDSPEEVDSSSSSPSTYVAGESQAVVMTAPTIVFPQKATVVLQEGHPLDLARPHSPRSRLSRTSLSGTPITTVDSAGQVIDLVKDALQEPQLSEEERLKNLDLLEQAKKVSDRFLTRRGRRSTCSLTEAPTGLTPNPTPPPSPSRAVGAAEVSYAATQSASPVKDQPNVPTQEQEGARLLVDWKPAEKRKVSSGTLTPRYAVQKENCDPSLAKKSITAPASPVAAAALTAGGRPEEGTSGPGRSPTQAPATGVAKPVPRLPTQQAPCTAEIKTIGAFPPLMRAVSWDTVGTLNSRNGAPPPGPGPEEVFTFPDKSRDGQSKQSGYKDFPAQPVATQKLSKLREEHKLLRNQSIVGSTLPELSETSEHEKGLPSPTSPGGEDVKEKTDSMPNISDVMLRKLKLHRGLPGCAPPLTEKEVENAFVQLSLAYRNDNYTLETRMKQAERERHLTEENTEKELEEFKGALKMTSPQWQNLEQREAYQRLIETVSVLHRLATRLSSRAEIVGAVRQEKRMNKATEVMMQYVENLKRTYEKDHAELMEFKKLANQNSIRCYGGSIDTGDDGVPRPSRSMSLTLGKALPRRRVSVAVVPKFNLLNIPGQTPAGPIPAPSYGPPPPSAGASGPLGGAALPVLCEATDSKGNASPVEAGQPTESGSRVSAPEGEPAAPAKPAVNVEELRAEIRAELKAKMEEEYYNKGYQEGLNKSKESQEICEEPEKVQATLLQSGNKDEESGKRSMAKKSSSKMEEVLVLLDRYWPKISWRHRPFWIALTLCLVIFLVVNVFTYLNGYNNSHVDSAEKALVQGKKKIFGLTVAAQPKNPTTE